jgi:hypothetical protein
VFGIRKTIREEIEQGNDSKVKYTIRPERLYFKAHDSDLESHEDYEELKGMQKDVSDSGFCSLQFLKARTAIVLVTAANILNITLFPT